MAKLFEKINGEAYLLEWKPMDSLHMKELGIKDNPETGTDMLEYLKAFYFLALKANDRSMTLDKAEDFMNDIIENYEAKDEDWDMVDKLKDVSPKEYATYMDLGLTGLDYLALLSKKVQDKSNIRQKPSPGRKR